jgi:hypothetical protein
MAVGAYARLQLLCAPSRLPLMAGAAAGRAVRHVLVGMLFGLPSLRMRGLYLAVATLAAQFFADWMPSCASSGSPDTPSGSVSVSNLQVFGMPIDSAVSKYLFCLCILCGHCAFGQEPGARPHRPRMDGHPRHGRGGRRDRHPADVRQAQRLRGQLLHRRRGRRAVGLRLPRAPGSRRPSHRPTLSGCCSW